MQQQQDPRGALADFLPDDVARRIADLVHDPVNRAFDEFCDALHDKEAFVTAKKIKGLLPTFSKMKVVQTRFDATMPPYVTALKEWWATADWSTKENFAARVIEARGSLSLHPRLAACFVSMHEDFHRAVHQTTRPSICIAADNFCEGMREMGAPQEQLDTLLNAPVLVSARERDASPFKKSVEGYYHV